jgi:polysaccharide deacetylase family protein (PEP-CTERM system associated)
MSPRPPLAFSIDFEGFAEAMEESFPVPERFSRFEIEAELNANADACLEVLARHGVRATFFILGWIGRDFPALVRRIAEAGHEIGSHALYHRRLWNLPEAQGREEIQRSKALLEDASGTAVVGFRAPDFSLRPDSPLFAHLVAMGFRYDASLNPTDLHDVYGDSTIPARIHRLDCGLVELPASVCRLPGGRRLTVGGGGYFRLFPGWWTRRGLRAAAHPVCYLHPCEIGGVYPQDIPMSALRRLRHTWGNGRLETKLSRLFATFQAMPVLDFLETHHAFA